MELIRTEERKMSEAIVVAVLSFVGTAIGSVVSILTANRLTNYKIESLEEQVKKHNNLIERMFLVEQKTAILDEQIKVANHRIADLETEVKK